MKSMIFAAGLGSRLKPLTDTMPKALVPVGGKPLLAHIIRKLKQAGSHEIIINVHHFADQIMEYVRSQNNFGIRIVISDERDALLETGGGLKKAAHFFDDGKPFLIHNVDILSNIDLSTLYQQHIADQSLATLVVSPRDTTRYLLFDKQYDLKGWINEKTGELRPAGFTHPENYHKLAFAGIQVVSPEIFPLMASRSSRFPIIDFYLSISKTHKIHGSVPDGFKMIDVGKLDVLEEAEEFYKLEILPDFE